MEQNSLVSGCNNCGRTFDPCLPAFYFVGYTNSSDCTVTPVTEDLAHRDINR